VDGVGGQPGRVAGLVLAAGAGRRAGGPKALRRDERGSWLALACARLAEGGCDLVLAVLGAGSTRAEALLPPGAVPVPARDWAGGASRSLAAGLGAARDRGAAAVLVTLVDLPNERAEAAARVLARGRRATGGAVAGALVRAAYDGMPGHPVLIGAAHWGALGAVLSGDAGARDYLARTDHLLVECGDLGGGADEDGPHSSTSPRRA